MSDTLHNMYVRNIMAGDRFEYDGRIAVATRDAYGDADYTHVGTKWEDDGPQWCSIIVPNETVITVILPCIETDHAHCLNHGCVEYACCVPGPKVSMVKAPHDVIVDRSFVGIPATADSIRVELNGYPTPPFCVGPVRPLVFM